MNVKAAVALAKQEVAELFADEDIKYLGLEQVDYDEDRHLWRITVGFSRPWDEPRNVFAQLSSPTYPRRAYKIIDIDDATNKVLAIRNWDERT